MIACARPAIWSTALWLMVFLFSYMTYTEASKTARLAPLVAIFIMLCMGIMLLATRARETKTLLWLGSWAVVLDIGVILSTLDVLDHTFLTIYVCVFTTLASFVWCIVGNADRASEPGWHWYVWSLTLTLALCIIVNYTVQDTLFINIFIAVLFIALHIAYTRHALVGLQPNRTRCRHLLRVFSVVTVIISILTVNILFKENVITQETWHEYILIVEGIVLLVIWIDATLSTFGFESDVTYNAVSNVDNVGDVFGV